MPDAPTLAYEAYLAGGTAPRTERETADGRWLHLSGADWRTPEGRLTLAELLLLDALPPTDPDALRAGRAASLAGEIADALLGPLAGQEAWRVTREEVLAAVRAVEATP